MGALLKTIATEQGFKSKTCSQVLNSFVNIAAKEVKKTGVFAIPGLCRIKTRTKPATKAGVRTMSQGGQGQGKASEDCCEGLPRCRAEEADLKHNVVLACCLRGLLVVGIPRRGLEMSTHGPEFLNFVHSSEALVK